MMSRAAGLTRLVLLAHVSCVVYTQPLSQQAQAPPEFAMPEKVLDRPLPPPPTPTVKLWSALKNSATADEFNKHASDLQKVADDSGDPHAQLLLGLLHSVGLGRKRDSAKAPVSTSTWPGPKFLFFCFYESDLLVLCCHRH